MNYINFPLLITEEEARHFMYSGGMVVMVCEDAPSDLANSPNALKASILLPPYEAVSAELDGNENDAYTLYTRHLVGNDEAAMYILILYLSLYRGRPVGVYFGPQVMEMRYPQFFMMHLQDCFGLTMGDPGNLGSMNEMFHPFVAELCLKLNLISSLEYIMMMPEGIDIYPDALIRLAIDYRPPIDLALRETCLGKYLEELNEYFKDLIKSQKTSPTPLINPIVGEAP